MAVTVKLPVVLKKTRNDRVPAASAAFGGRVAVESLEVIPTVSVIALTRFQLVSTTLTVTLTAVKVLCPMGVPVLPVALPGAAVSPGTSNCSFAKAPALTVTEGLVLAVMPV